MEWTEGTLEGRAAKMARYDINQERAASVDFIPEGTYTVIEYRFMDEKNGQVLQFLKRTSRGYEPFERVLRQIELAGVTNFRLMRDDMIETVYRDQSEIIDISYLAIE
jgi:hypothetical protein